jgi:ubiquitin carboxyl-terminal hydrolase 12/46
MVILFDIEIFSGTMQQDAHEMFNYLINEIAETVWKQKKEVYEAFSIKKEDSDFKDGFKTWVHELFQGQLTNETKCLNCESVWIFNVDYQPR